MKRKICLFLSLVFVSALILHADAETSTSFNNDVVKAVLQASLENGFSKNKDVLTMLDNALSNGYDYCNVTYSEQSGVFKIEVAIEGFASSLTFLDDNITADNTNVLAQTKESIISHCKAIYEICKTVGRDDISFMFKLLDDRPLFEFGLADVDCVTIIMSDGEVKNFFGMMIDAW